MQSEKKDESDAGRGWARTELLLGLFNHIEQQIGLGETRAGLLLAAGAASAVGYTQVIKEMRLWVSLESGGRLLLALALLSVAISILLALWAVRPAWIVTSLGKRRLRAAQPRPSMVDFASIAAHKRDEFVEAFQQKSERELQDDLLRAIHGKSLKARAKFTELLPAGFCLAASIVLFVLSLLTLYPTF